MGRGREEDIPFFGMRRGGGKECGDGQEGRVDEPQQKTVPPLDREGGGGRPLTPSRPVSPQAAPLDLPGLQEQVASPSMQAKTRPTIVAHLLQAPSSVKKSTKEADLQKVVEDNIETFEEIARKSPYSVYKKPGDPKQNLVNMIATAKCLTQKTKEKQVEFQGKVYGTIKE